MVFACSAHTDPSARHLWRGVIEDFIDLKLEKHSFECVVKHTENVLSKIRRTSSVDALVERGIIPPLVNVLKHEDLRQDALLQITALAALSAIVEKSAVGGHAFTVAEAGAVPCLLNLLQRRHVQLTYHVLGLLDLMTDEMDTEAVAEPSDLMEGVLEVINYGGAHLKIEALSFAIKMLGGCYPPLELSDLCIQGILRLLRDQDTPVLFLVCQGLNIITHKCTDDVAKKMLCQGLLPVVTQVLKNSRADENFADCVKFIVSFTRALVCRSPQHAQVFVEGEFLPCLEVMMNFGRGDLDIFSHVTWILASIISNSHADMVEQLLKKNLVPSIRLLFIEGSWMEQTNLAALLRRLFQSETYLTSNLDKSLLECLSYLRRNDNLDALGTLLAVVREALGEVKTQGKLQEMSSRMINSGMLEILIDLQNCSSPSIRAASTELVQLILPD